MGDNEIHPGKEDGMDLFNKMTRWEGKEENGAYALQGYLIFLNNNKWNHFFFFNLCLSWVCPAGVCLDNVYCNDSETIPLLFDAWYCFHCKHTLATYVLNKV